MTERLTLIIGNKNYSSWSLRPWLAMEQARFEFEEVRIPLDTLSFPMPLLVSLEKIVRIQTEVGEG